MAIVYFPSNTRIAQRNTVSASYEVIAFANYPNVIFFFDSGSNLQAISSSVTDAISASYAQSASYAANAGQSAPGGGGSSTQSLQLSVQSAKVSGSFVTSYPLCWGLELDTGTAGSWQFRMPNNYSSSLKNTIQFFATGSQTGTQTAFFKADLTYFSSSQPQVITASVDPQFSLGFTHSFIENQPGSWIREETVYLTGSSVPAGAFVIYKLTKSGGTMTGSVAIVSNTLEFVAS